MAQEYIKGTGTGRGGWRGGGRPKGSTSVNKENVKKMYSFRLSEAELKAVREVLAKMRGKFILLFCLFLFSLPCFALTLEGNVEYTEDTARAKAFEGVSKYLTFKNIEQYNRSLFIGGINYDQVRQIYNYKVSFMLKPIKVIGIIYKDEPDKLYGYIKKNSGYECVGIRVTEGTEYPRKTRNYYPKTGELMSVGLLTETEEYKYDKDGKLIGYWNGNNGKLNKNIKLPLKMQLLSVLDYGS